MATRNQLKMSTSDKQRRTFSDSFKLKKVREIELGHSKIADICKEYEVSYTSVYKWLDKFGMTRKKGERIILETDSDTKQLQAYKQKIAELEQVIGQKQIMIDFMDKMIEIAEDRYKIDIKKKPSTKPSDSFGKTENNTPLV